MYISLIICISLLLFNQLLLFVQSRFTMASSDHWYHFGLIKGIRKSGHRFLNGYPYILGETNFAYPQFFHWILSFFPTTFIEKKYHYVGQVVNQIALTAFLIFVLLVFPSLKLAVGINYCLLISGLFYILQPFNFAIWNAKNTGLSARGVGVLFSALYLYFLSGYLINHNFLFFVLTAFVSFLVVISSVFAFQFLLFSSILLAALFLQPVILVFPIAAILIFYIHMPTIARNFLVGQYWMKYTYAKYLTEIFLVRFRRSIWRDWIWDIWVKWKTTDSKKMYQYIYMNSLTSLVYGFPLLWIIAWNYSDAFMLQNRWWFYPVIASTILFFLTAFRQLRFLGEAERYIEMTTPLIAIGGTILIINSISLVIWVLTFCIVLYIVQMVLLFFQGKYAPDDGSDAKQIKKLIEKIDHSPAKKIFSNSTIFMKFFHDEWYLPLIPCQYNLYTGSLRYNELFDDACEYLATDKIEMLAQEFNITYFIHDEKALTIPIEKFFTTKNINPALFGKVDHYTIYKLNYTAKSDE